MEHANNAREDEDNEDNEDKGSFQMLEQAPSSEASLTLTPTLNPLNLTLTLALTFLPYTLKGIRGNPVPDSNPNLNP